MKGELLTTWAPPPASEEWNKPAQKDLGSQVVYESQNLTFPLLEHRSSTQDHWKVSRWFSEVLTFGFRYISWVLRIQHLNTNQITYLHTPHVYSLRKMKAHCCKTKKDYKYNLSALYTQGFWRAVTIFNSVKQSGRNSSQNLHIGWKKASPF